MLKMEELSLRTVDNGNISDESEGYHTLQATTENPLH